MMSLNPFNFILNSRISFWMAEAINFIKLTISKQYLVLLWYQKTILIESIMILKLNFFYDCYS